MKWFKLFEDERELQRAFGNSETYPVDAEGTIICISRWKGDLFAIQNSCPHAGASLSDGSINAEGEIVCPQHGYRFSLPTGREAGMSCPDAKTFPIKQDNGSYYLGIQN